MTDGAGDLWRPSDAESRKDFWQGVHDSKEVDGVSWWQSVPGLSLGLVDESGIGVDDGVIDVGSSPPCCCAAPLDPTDLKSVSVSSTAA